jgi:hypothetical protein
VEAERHAPRKQKRVMTKAKRERRSKPIDIASKTVPNSPRGAPRGMVETNARERLFNAAGTSVAPIRCSTVGTISSTPASTTTNASGTWGNHAWSRSRRTSAARARRKRSRCPRQKPWNYSVQTHAVQRRVLCLPRLSAPTMRQSALLLAMSVCARRRRQAKRPLRRPLGQERGARETPTKSRCAQPERPISANTVWPTG